MTDDVLVWPLLTSLCAALKEEVEEAGLPEFCFVGILPGSDISMEHCNDCGGKCGMAWVRLSSIIEDPEAVGTTRCVVQLSANVEIGMLRCHQTSTERGEPMSAEYQHDKAQAQLAEMASMKKVLLCSDIVKDLNKVLGSYTPVGPVGGCVGGAWTARYDLF